MPSRDIPQTINRRGHSRDRRDVWAKPSLRSPGSRRPLRPASKKKPSVCRHKPEIIVSRWCAHCSVSAFNRVISTRLTLLRPNGQTVITFGIPPGLAPTDQGLLLSPFDCHTRHPKQIPLWVAITVSAPKHLESKTDRGFGREAGEFLRVVQMRGQR